jgi:hypothetical protein
MGIADVLANATGKAGGKTKKAKGEGIHYIVIREKGGDWDKVVKFFGTDSPAKLGNALLAIMAHAPAEFKTAGEAAFKRLTKTATPAPAPAPAPVPVPVPVASAPAK